MTITWPGHYTVKLFNSSTTIIINPYSPNLGLSSFRAKADYVFLTNPVDPTTSHTDGIQGDYICVDSAGEYSFEKLTAYGTGWFQPDTNVEQIIYSIHFENLSILYLGSLNRKLNQAELQILEQTNVDILIVPIGGSTSIDSSVAIDLVSTVEPNIVIPINYAIPKLNQKVEPVAKFAKEMGVNPKSDIKKVTIAANKIDRENVTTIILNP